MYVYLKSQPGLYTVGFYSPNGDWNPEGDYETPEDAADRVHYLNGGNQRDKLTESLCAKLIALGGSMTTEKRQNG